MSNSVSSCCSVTGCTSPVSVGRSLDVIDEQLQWRAHPEGLAEGVNADGQDHELLHGQRVARVAAAVDDVERRHREHLCGTERDLLNELAQGLGLGSQLRPVATPQLQRVNCPKSARISTLAQQIVRRLRPAATWAVQGSGSQAHSGKRPCRRIDAVTRRSKPQAAHYCIASTAAQILLSNGWLSTPLLRGGAVAARTSLVLPAKSAMCLYSGTPFSAAPALATAKLTARIALAPV